MKKETYQKLMHYFCEHPHITKLLHITNKILTGAVFLAYPLLLFWFWWNRDFILASAIIVPLDALLVVTAFRYVINRKRPYEVFGTAPAIPKKTQGKSFPSRHVFSVFIIAMTYLCLSPWPMVGLLLILAGCLLAAVRVLTGVHFISDVLCGAAVGILAGVIGYICF